MTQSIRDIGIANKVKEIGVEVIPMKNATNSNRSNVLILMAMFGVMVVMSPRPARAQQDVDPTWYDPWTPATPVVAHVVSHANHTTTAQANQAQTLKAKKENVKLTSGSTQKTAKLHKTTVQAKQS
jgi:hypothetical protein